MGAMEISKNYVEVDEQKICWPMIYTILCFISNVIDYFICGWDAFLTGECTISEYRALKHFMWLLTPNWALIFLYYYLRCILNRLFDISSGTLNVSFWVSIFSTIVKLDSFSFFL